jgi:hypothetical protein
LKIIGKDKFKEGEWKTTKLFIEEKNENIIRYENIYEITAGNQIYIVFMMEYANAGVLLLIKYIYS